MVGTYAWNSNANLELPPILLLADVPVLAKDAAQVAHAKEDGPRSVPALPAQSTHHTSLIVSWLCIKISDISTSRIYQKILEKKSFQPQNQDLIRYGVG